MKFYINYIIIFITKIIILRIILSVLTLFIQIFFLNTCSIKAQTYSSDYKKNIFDVKGVFYRHPTYSGTDTKFKFLGNVTATIEQTSKGFRLIKINGNKVKMDPPPLVDLNNNQNGQVTECTISDNYWYEAHYRKNGISYSVCFNSKRIRDYYISH